MKTKLSGLFILSAFALLTLGAGVGCSDDDDDDGGGSSGGTLTNCNSLCDAQEAEGCGLGDASQCKQICSGFSQADAACTSAYEAYAGCQLDDPCNLTGCQDEAMAYAEACNASQG